LASATVSSTEHLEKDKVRGGVPSRLYIPSLDGLRAVAFMIVFMSHTGLGNIIPGGFGVTIFFFLSGFLITSLFRHEFALTGTISIKHFYLRRILRIFPPLYICLAAMVSMVALKLLPGQINFWPIVSQSTFLTNYYVLFGENPTGIPEGSGVLWSLAVEEHFYLIFPLFIVATFGVLSRTRHTGCLTIACVVVLVWRIVLVFYMHADEMRTYIATDTRIDSILYGCLLALSLNPAIDRIVKSSNGTKIAAYAIAIGLLLFSFLYRDEHFRNTLRYSVQGVALYAIFYFAIIESHKPWFSWLNWRAVRFFGTLTYTMYLSHLSIISSLQFLNPNINQAIKGVLAFALTATFATLMYFIVERPCASIRRRLEASP
jgi:peptidoglycan/LPS O-acetylase OafA/YrhL